MQNNLKFFFCFFLLLHTTWTGKYKFTYCFLAELIELNLKPGNFPSVKGNRNSLDGKCGGGLIMESKISRDKSTHLSNRESPLPSVFLCLMQCLTCNCKSEVSCHRLIKSQVESRWPPKISLNGKDSIFCHP